MIQPTLLLGLPAHVRLDQIEITPQLLLLSLEGRKYSGSRISVSLAVFGESPALLLLPLFPAPRQPSPPPSLD